MPPRRQTHLSPPLVGVLANGLGMGLLVSLDVGTDERHLGTVGHARRNGVEGDGIVINVRHVCCKVESRGFRRDVEGR